jgi:hypothetical protein
MGMVVYPVWGHHTPLLQRTGRDEVRLEEQTTHTGKVLTMNRHFIVTSHIVSSHLWLFIRTNFAMDIQHYTAI